MFIAPFYMKLDSKINYSPALKKGNQVGLSLGLSTFLFTKIVNPEIILLDILLGTYTYGIDREHNDNNMMLYNSIFGLCCLILLKNNLTSLYIPILYFTKFYKKFKKNLKIFKPWFITILWCLTVIVLPNLYLFNDFNLGENEYNVYSFGCLLFALSNLNDCKDIISDTKNNITTFANYFNIKLIDDIIFINLLFGFIFYVIYLRYY